MPHVAHLPNPSRAPQPPSFPSVSPPSPHRSPSVVPPKPKSDLKCAILAQFWPPSGRLGSLEAGGECQAMGGSMSKPFGLTVRGATGLTRQRRKLLLK